MSLKRALALIDELAESGELDGYHLLHAARADLLRRLGAKRGSGRRLRTRAFKLSSER